ncbi:MAG: AI-2E family transporter [Streptococcaceae bacterium]|jgi:predicted PurR-regulated permease PerM|nr:AI-2E family transporter [Streptococcaceae bacterium]
MEKKRPIFFDWFLNNKIVTFLLILFLILLNILVLTKVAWVFEPFQQFVQIVGFPIILAVVFYYLLNPIVNYFETKKIPRAATIAVLFVLILGLLIWGIVVLIPNLEKQIENFLKQVPYFVKTIDHKSKELLENGFFAPFRERLLEWTNDLSKKILEFAQTASTHVIDGIGNIVATITTVVLGLITMPFILFYLLLDGKDLLPKVLKAVPVRWRNATEKILVDMNGQISNYIRGQILVALAVAGLFLIGFKIIGLDYAVTIAISAGILNMIPYLGSFLAMLPALVLGVVGGPVFLLKVIVVFIVEQTLEGRLISPLVLGNQLKIHPVTILLVLLTSGKVLGLLGVIIGIPLYAVVKVLVTHVYDWYREVSGLYEEDQTAEAEK